MNDAGRLAAACSTLVAHYPTDDWWPASSAFEVMVGAILVQNTRWANASRAIEALRNARLLEPEALSRHAPESLVRLVRPAGCQRVKGPRLLNLAGWVVGQGGVARLARRPGNELRIALLGVAGIGPETADVILCFAFNRPTFVADAYARRWLQRFGLLDARQAAAYEPARRSIDPWLASARQDLAALHAAIVQHGQRHCARVPECPACPVSGLCQYYKKQ